LEFEQVVEGFLVAASRLRRSREAQSGAEGESPAFRRHAVVASDEVVRRNPVQRANLPLSGDTP